MNKINHISKTKELLGSCMNSVIGYKNNNLFNNKYFFINGKNLEEYSFNELKNIIHLLMKDKIFNSLNYFVHYDDIKINIDIENINKAKLILNRLILNFIKYNPLNFEGVSFFKIKNNIDHKYFFNDHECDMLMIFKYFNEELV